MTRPDIFLFDWDGTLVDSLQFLEDAHNAVLAQLGLVRFDAGGFRPFFGKPRDYIYSTIYGDKALAAKALFEDYVASNQLSGLYPIDGAGDFLRKLHGLDIPMMIVSNKRRVFIETEISHFGWDGYFSGIIGAGDAEADKPSPAPLALACHEAGVIKPRYSIFFGDTENDARAAQVFGSDLVVVGDETCSSMGWLAGYTPIIISKNFDVIFQFLLQSFDR